MREYFLKERTEYRRHLIEQEFITGAEILSRSNVARPLGYEVLQIREGTGEIIPPKCSVRIEDGKPAYFELQPRI